MQLDSSPPKVDLAEFIRKETRFRSVEAADPVRAQALLEAARHEVRSRYALYEQLARPVAISGNGAEGAAQAPEGSGEKT